MFFLWASAVMLATQAFDINTSLSNAVQYIGQVFVTSDGTPDGTDGVFLDGSNGGKIGIGTDSPSYNLHIKSTGYPSLALEWPEDSARSINFIDSGSVASYINSNSSSSELSIWNNHWMDIVFGTTNAERMRINSNGDVGIGIITPAQKLDVAWNIRLNDSLIFRDNSTAKNIYAETTDDGPGVSMNIRAWHGTDLGGWDVDGWNLNLSAGNWDGQSHYAWWSVYITWGNWYEPWKIYLNWWVGDQVIGNVILANAGWSVGIGTTTPWTKLEVNGTIRLTTGGVLQARANANQL
jgi:hypothetical protein